MRLLIISTFFPPVNSIASLRPYSWAKYWTRAGHDVTVLTTVKKSTPLDLKWENNGFQIIEVPLPAFANSLKQKNQSSGGKGSFLQTLRKNRGIFHSCRMPDLSDLWILPALKAATSHEPWDLIISTCGPYAVHIVADRLKKRGQAKKWIADYRDRWSDNHIFPGLFPFSLIERVLEKKLMKNADAITTVSAPYAAPYKKKYAPEKVHIVENGFDPEDLDDLSTTSVFPTDDKIRLVNTGSFYSQGQDPSPLFKAIKRLEAHPFIHRLEVMFAGPSGDSLNALIQKFNVGSWVKTIGFVERTHALRMQRDANALLLFPWIHASADGVVSGKLAEYLFSGTPILSIGADSREASSKIIQESGAGKLLTTVQECQDTLVSLLEDRKIETATDQEFIKRYTRALLADQLLHIGKNL